MLLDQNYSARISSLLHQYCNDIYITIGILDAIANQKPIDSYLDVGCGSGLKSMPFANLAKEVTLIELLPEYEKDLKIKFPQANILIDSIDNVLLDIKRKFDVILFSQNLYYHREEYWLQLSKKLFSLLNDNGILIIIMNSDSNDWWRAVSKFKALIGEHMCFHYKPVSLFANELQAIGDLNIMTYQVQSFLPNKEIAIECLGRQILQIRNDEIYENNISNFSEFIETLPVINQQIIFNHDISVIVLTKNKTV